MTEEQWRTCAEPETMLRFLQGKATDRKLRLFAVACCRRIWGLLDDERSRAAVETSERYSEGSASAAELHTAWTRAEEVPGAFWTAIQEGRATLPNAPAQEAAAVAAERPLRAHRVASEAATACVWAGRPVLEEMQATRARENRFQCDLLRDLFGNPFSPTAVSPAWLSWHAGTAVSHARSIYDRRRFTALPRLAETLEAAGCTDADILGHCRSPGPHVRGCWAVDLLLGKQ